jgi:predicted metal-dependent hydrolase
MEIVKVLEILNNHILKLEEELQFKEWEIERLKENEEKRI